MSEPERGSQDWFDWTERDLLRGTEDPAAWGVPEDYAAGYIAGVHAFREALQLDPRAFMRSVRRFSDGTESESELVDRLRLATREEPSDHQRHEIGSQPETCVWCQRYLENTNDD
jgi:hypothetical protein